MSSYELLTYHELEQLSKEELLEAFTTIKSKYMTASEHNSYLEVENKKLLDEKETLLGEIRESESLYKAVIENSLDGTLILDDEFTVIFGNEEMYKIGSYSSEDMFALDFRQFLPTEYLDNFLERIKFTIDNPDTDNRFDSVLIAKDGSYRNIYVSASLNKDFQGKSAIICQVLDISEIKKAEETVRKINEDLEKKVIERTQELEKVLRDLKVENIERQKAELELQEAKDEVLRALDQEKELNTLKSRFISMISHEYRTPLTVILTSTYLIEQFYQGPNQLQFNKFLDKIRASVKSMTQLLQDVLTIGRNEASSTQLNVIKIRAVELCKEIIEEAQVIDNNHHNFELNFTDKSIELETDEKQIRHILSNLVTNAAKYSPNSKNVVVNVSEDERGVHFQIIDEGIGIPEEDQEHLFDAFYRAGNVGAISGTGLGLAIVKRCVTLLNGEISFRSEKEKGTTFFIDLPKKLEVSNPLF
jgi:PAS domain S-box-containing protein